MQLYHYHSAFFVVADLTLSYLPNIYAMENSYKQSTRPIKHKAICLSSGDKKRSCLRALISTIDTVYEIRGY